jgi:hypothetical protein
MTPEFLDDRDGYAHIGEETHEARLWSADFFAGKPGRVLYGLRNVLALEVRMVRQDLVERGPVGDLTDDDGHGDAHASNAGPATHDIWIERDSLEHCPFPFRDSSVGPRNEGRRGVGRA